MPDQELSDRTNDDGIFPCPCCGYLEFSGPPGTDDICPICWWEDDVSQLRFPKMSGGANKCSLIAAQKNFANIGASSDAWLAKVRPPSPQERRDPDWRPIDATDIGVVDEIDILGGQSTYPSDYTKLYYWKDRYWRRKTQ